MQSSAQSTITNFTYTTYYSMILCWTASNRYAKILRKIQSLCVQVYTGPKDFIDLYLLSCHCTRPCVTVTTVTVL